MRILSTKKTVFSVRNPFLANNFYNFFSLSFSSPTNLTLHYIQKANLTSIHLRLLFFSGSMIISMKIIDIISRFHLPHIFFLLADCFPSVNLFCVMVIIEQRENLLIRRKASLTSFHSHITICYRHLFTVTSSLLLFVYWSVTDTDRLLFYLVLRFVHERPLAFNAI